MEPNLFAFRGRLMFRLQYLPALAAMALLSADAYAASSARVVDTHPGEGELLGINEALYFRIEYSTDEPISLWARPYLRGRQIQKAMSNASAKYAGAGEALGWFALTQPGEIDEVRIIAGGGQPYREWELARAPLRISWGATRAARRAEVQWVATLKAAESERLRQAVESRANEPVSAAEVTLFNGFMLLMLAIGIVGVAAPFWSMRRWSGGWKIAAAIPAVVMAFVILRILVDTARDPTSHNLWPFEILMWSAASLATIGVLKLARKTLRLESSR